MCNDKDWLTICACLLVLRFCLLAITSSADLTLIDTVVGPMINAIIILTVVVVFRKSLRPRVGKFLRTLLFVR